MVHINRLKRSKQKPEITNRKVRLKTLPRTHTNEMNENAICDADIELADNTPDDCDPDNDNTNRLIAGGPIHIMEEEADIIDEDDDNEDDTVLDEVFLDPRDPEWIPERCRRIDSPTQETHSYNLRPRVNRSQE